MSIFCKHNWKFLKTHTLPSLAQEAKNVGFINSPNNLQRLVIKAIHTYTCNKCGALKIIKTDNWH